MRSPSALEGSRFWSCPEGLVKLLSDATKTKSGVKQAAPGSYRTRCSVPWCCSAVLDSLNPPINLSRVETFLGAACLTSHFCLHRLSKSFARSTGAIQSGSPPMRWWAIAHRGNGPRCIEDEKKTWRSRESDYDWRRNQPINLRGLPSSQPAMSSTIC
jgi:hypothetical protein